MKRRVQKRSRLIAFLLCAVMIIGIIPVIGVSAAEDKLNVSQTEVNLPENRSVELNASSNLGNAAYQWQVYVPSAGVWANISGECSTTIKVTYAMVANVLSGRKATLRATAKVNDEVLTSNEITVTVTDPEFEASEPAMQTFALRSSQTGDVSVEDTPAEDTDLANLNALYDAFCEAEAAKLAAEEKLTAAESALNAAKEETAAAEAALAAAKQAAENETADVEQAAVDETETDSDQETEQVTEEAVQETEQATATSPAPVVDTSELEAALAAAQQKQQDAQAAYDEALVVYNEAQAAYTEAETSYHEAEAAYAPVMQVDLFDLEEDDPEPQADQTVTYYVYRFLQNVDNDFYTKSITDTMSGTAGEVVPGDLDTAREGFYALPYDTAAVITEGMELDIYYDRYYYLMNFNLDGGYGVEPIYARYGTPIGDVGTPTKPGYTFDGWNTTLPATMPASNSTYKANWNPLDSVNFTVVFWYENANDDGYSYAGSTTAAAKPGTTVTSETYQSTPFDGRDDTHFTYNDAKAESKTVAGDGSTVLNVYFTRNTYTLTFKSSSNNNATTYGTITAKYQADIADQWPTAGTTMAGSNTAVPSNLYYWSFNGVAQATKIFTMTDEICNTRGLTLIANTSNNLSTYTINYYLESLDGTGTQYNGTYYKKSDVYSQTLQYAKNTTKWNYKDIDGFIHPSDGETVSNNNTVNLYYTRNRNTITFYDGYGTTTATISDVMFEMPLSNVTYNNAPISYIVPAYPADLEPGVYSFAGWYTTSGCFDGTEADFDNDIMPNANLAFYAKWVPITHVVSFYMDSEAFEIDEKLADYGNDGVLEVPHNEFATGISAPSNSEPSDPYYGYKFVGWFYMEDGVEKAFDFANMPVVKDMKVYAKWTSDTQVKYFVYYRIVGANGDVNDVADPTTGYQLAGYTKNFAPKTPDQLYPGYSSVCTIAPEYADSHTMTMKLYGEGETNPNTYTFWYTEATAAFTYIAVGPEGATNFGSLSKETETVAVITGDATGSTPTAATNYRFVGWFTDEDCTTEVEASLVHEDNTIIPEKTVSYTGTNVTGYQGTTFYAKFEYDLTDLTIVKNGGSGELFEFRVVCSDQNIDLTVCVPGGGRITLKDLPIGNYTVTENNGWSYRYTCSGDSSITLVAGNDNTLTFTNTLSNDHWLGDEDFERNIFTGTKD